MIDSAHTTAHVEALVLAALFDLYVRFPANQAGRPESGVLGLDGAWIAADTLASLDTSLETLRTDVHDACSREEGEPCTGVPAQLATLLDELLADVSNQDAGDATARLRASSRMLMALEVFDALRVIGPQARATWEARAAAAAPDGGDDAIDLEPAIDLAGLRSVVPGLFTGLAPFLIKSLEFYDDGIVLRWISQPQGALARLTRDPFQRDVDIHLSDDLGNGYDYLSGDAHDAAPRRRFGRSATQGNAVFVPGLHPAAATLTLTLDDSSLTLGVAGIGSRVGV